MLGKRDGFRNIHDGVMRGGVNAVKRLEGTRQSVKLLAQPRSVASHKLNLGLFAPVPGAQLRSSIFNRYNDLLFR